MTRSKRSLKNSNVESTEINLSQSKKQKKTTDQMNTSSKDKNTILNNNTNHPCKRRQKRPNEYSTQMESNNTSVQEIEISNNENRREEDIENGNETVQNKTISMDECEIVQY